MKKETSFIADDGKRFYDEASCLDYERKIPLEAALLEALAKGEIVGWKAVGDVYCHYGIPDYEFAKLVVNNADKLSTLLTNYTKGN